VIATVKSQPVLIVEIDEDAKEYEITDESEEDD
jgi:hypothetical protein